MPGTGGVRIKIFFEEKDDQRCSIALRLQRLEAFAAPPIHLPVPFAPQLIHLLSTALRLTLRMAIS